MFKWVSILILLVLLVPLTSCKSTNESLPDLIQQVEPSVVTIFDDIVVVEHHTHKGHHYYKHVTLHVQGSGTIIDSSNGYILTNSHVIHNGKNFRVVLSDGKSYNGDLIKEDTGRDLAILQIDAPDLQQLDLGDSDKVRPGESIIVVGSPFGLQNSVSSGIISNVNVIVDYDTPITYLQTNAAINHGNSGGALINMKGELIGVPQSFVTSDPNLNLATSSGVGLAIPSNDVKEFIKDLPHKSDKYNLLRIFK